MYVPPIKIAPPPLPKKQKPKKPPPRAPPGFDEPLINPDDDDEILCDCGWILWPGQSCKETKGKAGFPCWDSCCHGQA